MGDVWMLAEVGCNLPRWQVDQISCGRNSDVLNFEAFREIMIWSSTLEPHRLYYQDNSSNRLRPYLVISGNG